MLIIISSAKTIKFHRENKLNYSSECIFDNEVKEVTNILKAYSEEDIKLLMKVSPKLAKENYLRYQKFFYKDTVCKEAILAFSGGVYRGIDIDTFDKDDLMFTKENLRILSGLYGVIRPFDMIKEYRLEMATKIKNLKGDNLYDFWRDKITDRILSDIKNSSGEKILINLASKEYSDAIDLKEVALKYPIIDIEFREKKGLDYKIIATYAKRARGLMARFIIKNKIEEVKEISNFNLEGYKFNGDLSKKDKFLFTR